MLPICTLLSWPSLKITMMLPDDFRKSKALNRSTPLSIAFMMIVPWSGKRCHSLTSLIIFRLSSRFW